MWADTICELHTFSCMCSYNSSAYLKLRGLPPNSLLDNLYKPINNWTNNGKMKLQGLKMNSIPRTSITLDENKKVWILKVANSSINATSKAPHASFTLGKHIWTFTRDESRSPGIKYERELKMSGCQDYQYTCNNGQCVSMNQRCNQLPDSRADLEFVATVATGGHVTFLSAV